MCFDFSPMSSPAHHLPDDSAWGFEKHFVEEKSCFGGRSALDRPISCRCCTFLEERVISRETYTITPTSSLSLFLFLWHVQCTAVLDFLGARIFSLNRYVRNWCLSRACQWKCEEDQVRNEQKRNEDKTARSIPNLVKYLLLPPCVRFNKLYYSDIINYTQELWAWDEGKTRRIQPGFRSWAREVKRS